VDQRRQALVSSLSPRVPSDSDLKSFLRKLPKAELHLHLEGALSPHRVAGLAKKYGVELSASEIELRYNTRSFAQFLELYKWATFFLREPDDYARLAEDTCANLKEQGVVYAEITLSIGVMLLRKQDVRANFRAIHEVFEGKRRAGEGPTVQFIFDAVRQFGPAPAMEIVELAVEHREQGVVAFGLGGDELSLPLSEFQTAYKRAAEAGLHLLAHAGETGGPDQIRDAIDLLGAERIGHGIAAIRDPALMARLAQRKIPLEICPTSNLRTNALNLQLNGTDLSLVNHPLPKLFRAGIPVSLSTDDPAMFHTTLVDEYLHARKMGLSLDELLQINRAAFDQAFLSPQQRALFLSHVAAAF
jgi:aminodeoxyfutalosine deaminase